MVEMLVLNIDALLRARGGISWSRLFGAHRQCSSPRTRRYFLVQAGLPPGASLFSAHAEVFPTPYDAPGVTRALLRARGGISLRGGMHMALIRSSPRTRRYFHYQSSAGGD